MVDLDPRRAPGPRPRRSHSLIVLLVLASLTVITLDAKGGDNSPIEPLRTVVGNVIGPVETVSAAAVRPFSDLTGALRDNQSLRHQVASLTAENSRLRTADEVAPLDRRRLAEYDGLSRTARDTGYSLVPARVVGIGPAQSFNRTVTIDAGTSSGVRTDMTVLNGDGLVGRVIRVTSTTATVLLIADKSSVVGGRLGANLEIGNVRGEGSIDGNGRLELDLVDSSVTPQHGDVVVTWGSDHGVPYVAGIPIGKVTSVYSNPRDLTNHAEVEPFVDFSSLDVVGVVVPRGTHGDRAVIKGAAR
ncbi:rod shape-determining protein MreC [Nocardioides terrisoli]|uniref:rod shape-determining protein MreC n=1 Tax=Nocardioides terrisoli TaxID=3388267 RepID=UPI00287B8772|nr:rod shape-determining protein MreC [Nocardioides marmorisolisilvae]